MIWGNPNVLKMPGGASQTLGTALTGRFALP